MHLLLFESLAHLFSEFVEKLPDGAIIEIASILRKDLAGKDSDRLAVAGGLAASTGIDDFAAGEHPGQKRVVPRSAVPHPAVRCPDSLFEIIDPPRRPVPGAKPERDLELAPWPFRCLNKAE